MRLWFTRRASHDLTRLRDFIAEHDPCAAAPVSKRLSRTIRLLRHQPELGRALDALPNVRKLAAGDYVVRYTATEEGVVILRVWHGREDR